MDKKNLISRLRKTLLPPESPQELFLRTLYHRVNASPWFVKRQIKAAQTSFAQWRELQRKKPLQWVKGKETPPSVAFLLNVNYGNGNDALQTLRSINKLRSGDWRVIPVSEDGDLPDVIKNGRSDVKVLSPLRSDEISEGIRALIDADFLVFCAAGDVFDECLLENFGAAFSHQPLADVYYYDCELMRASPEPAMPIFKPSADSPELMFSFNYLSRGFIRRSSAVQLIPLWLQVSDPLVFEFELLIRLLAMQRSTCHIPRLLLTQATVSEETEEGIDAVIREHLTEKGFFEVSVERGAFGRRVTWNDGEPSVSIIILNRDHGSWLRALVNSIFILTDYANYSLIIVDNNSTEADVHDFYSELKENERVQVVNYEDEFNYSAAINIGVSRSDAEVVVLLNNDMQVTDPRWLHELVRWAIRPEIGVVGGKLLHRNRTIQHAGIVLGMNGFIGHLYLNAPEHYLGMAGSVDWYRNFYALTGACQAMRRALFHQVGGYDERFRLAFGDIDFCLRVINAGYRNLYNPHAELIHYEGGSRGYETPVKDILLGYDVLGPWLKKDDAYFSPNLTYTPIPRCNFMPEAVNARLANIETRKRSLESGKDTRS